jgi:hypothetical protein
MDAPFLPCLMNTARACFVFSLQLSLFPLLLFLAGRRVAFFLY